MTRIALTFDDGYAEHYALAKLMEGLKVRATFFVITRLTSWEGSPLLTQRDSALSDVAEMGHEIGAHTLTHPNLTLLSGSEAEREISVSKKDLEEASGVKVRGFAYPFGLYNPMVKNIVKKHFEYARTASTQTGDPDVYEIPIVPFNVLGTFAVSRKAVFPGGGDVAIIAHRLDAWILRSWVGLMKNLGAEFITLGELAANRQ